MVSNKAVSCKFTYSLCNSWLIRRLCQSTMACCLLEFCYETISKLRLNREEHCVPCYSLYTCTCSDKASVEIWHTRHQTCQVPQLCNFDQHLPSIQVMTILGDPGADPGADNWGRRTWLLHAPISSILSTSRLPWVSEDVIKINWHYHLC